VDSEKGFGREGCVEADRPGIEGGKGERSKKKSFHLGKNCEARRKKTSRIIGERKGRVRKKKARAVQVDAVCLVNFTRDFLF